MNQERADSALVRIGLARSRAVASDLIKTGCVSLGSQKVVKPSQLVDAAALSVEADDAVVSRAGGKLAAAIADLRTEGFDLNIENQNCLDIGASTGGFTQVLLENGAAKVIALDVGHGQLSEQLRLDPRVTVMERVNARYLTRDQLPFQPSFITCDVSFISLTFVFAPIRAVAEPGAQVLLLIKPQFEVGKGKLGKGGIVRDPALIAKTIDDVRESAATAGIKVEKVIPSQVVGTNGNQEYFLFGNLKG